jgi:hypothetical protein
MHSLAAIAIFAPHVQLMLLKGLKTSAVCTGYGSWRMENKIHACGCRGCSSLRKQAERAETAMTARLIKFALHVTQAHQTSAIQLLYATQHHSNYCLWNGRAAPVCSPEHALGTQQHSVIIGRAQFMSQNPF